MQWQQVVDSFGESLFRTAYRVLRHVGDAEDTTQDVLLEAYRTFQESGRLPEEPLLRRMALLRAIDRLRRRRVTAPLSEVDLVSREHAPERALEKSEQADRLRQAISRLPQREAESFMLRYVEGLSNQQIAEVLEITPSAVSTALNKARHKLREVMILEETQ